MTGGPEFLEVEQPFLDQLVSMGWKMIMGSVDHPSVTGRESFCSNLTHSNLTQVEVLVQVKSGDIPESWKRRLNLLLGTEDWYDEFYRVETTPTLFGDDQERVVKATMETIGHYFNNRLKEIFAGVVDEPGVLRNSSNNPLYLLCFAVGNERGKEIALRIAKHLLKEMR